MQKSGRRTLKKLLIPTLFICVFSLPSDADAQPRDHISLAQALVRSAFPNIGGDVSVTLDPGDLDNWLLAPVMTVSVRKLDPNASHRGRVVLSINIQATDGVLTSASLFDESMHADRVELFRMASQKGGDVASNVVSELRNRGAKHIPAANADFLAAFNADRFSTVIGPIQNTRAHFQAVPPIQVGRNVEFWPTWILDVKTVRRLCYSLLVDPITLNLTRIMRVQCE